MARFYQDFVGLNTFIYEPVGWDANGEQFIDLSPEFLGGSEVVLADIGAPQDVETAFLLNQNQIGADSWVAAFFGINDVDIGNFKNRKFEMNLPNTASFFNALMSHRGNVYGYSTWRQIRVSNNPLTRKQRKNNILTYVQEPGVLVGNRPSRYGNINVFKEPVVVGSYKPLSLVGDVSVYNEQRGEFQDRSVELKTSFGNETVFFANKEVNEYFDTILETDDNYEQLKELYLDGGLDDDGSPIDAFNLLIYKQTVFPKQQYAYLDDTRTRKYYVNTFWRDLREDRTQTDVNTGFGSIVPSQSMWPLDVPADWETRPEPAALPLIADTLYTYYIGAISGSYGSYFFGAQYEIAGYNTGLTQLGAEPDTLGGSGILMNSYSEFARGRYDSSDGTPLFNFDPAKTVENLGDYFYSSPFYSKRHTLNRFSSVVAASGMPISVVTDRTDASLISTGSLFEGMAAWDAGKISESVGGASKNPFYDSYEQFGKEIRTKGKGFAKIPEFKISSHVEEFLTKGITEELKNIFELSGGLSQNSTTETEGDFYQILSTSDFLKHFDLIKKDHKDFTKESILTLKCKAIKKFLPYEGFYPAQQAVEVAKEFQRSIQDDVIVSWNGDETDNISLGLQGLLEPLFAPGILFNTIKSGVAVDYPIVLPKDNPFYIYVDYRGYNTVTKTNLNAATDRINYLLAGSDLSPFDEDNFNGQSIWSKRIDFEALLNPEDFFKEVELATQDGHPYSLREVDGHPITYKWGGRQKNTYKKKINNFLAETAELFLEKPNFSTISSAEEQDPNFGTAKAGNYYTMRIKMYHTRNKANYGYESWGGNIVNPPQDIHAEGVKENFTMYSRASSFGTNVWGTFQSGSDGTEPLDSMWGNNYCFTPPYYYGESWCDLIFYADETKKYTLEEIMSGSFKFPYYTRHWQPGVQDTLRDLTGYYDTGSAAFTGIYSEYDQSPWRELFDESNGNNVEINSQVGPSTQIYDTWFTLQGLKDADINYQEGRLLWPQFGTIYPTRLSGSAQSEAVTSPPQHPSLINYNAMQLDSSVNIFGKGTIREKKNLLTGDTVEVASSQTVRGKTRWIIQTKFETPMLNFNKYSDLNLNGCTVPDFGEESVPRGMWHQYGILPSDNEGVFLQVTEIPETWLGGALNISSETYRRKVRSLADLVGFSKEPVRLGEVAKVKEISEAVVAIPFIEKNGTRQFFSIPRADIDSCIDATRREVDPGTFVAGGPPKAGDSVYQMVKKMKKYVFPPSMDFVRYKEIDPFAMYIFEFKHNLTKQDLADIWQNLPPEIGTRMEEAEASISHELLAHELLGGGAVVKNGTLDDNAEGNGIPSNIQWMVFKAKKRAKTNYFDKVVAKKGTTEDTSSKQLENASGQTGDDPGITYNWPYDFFSLVELVKLDAEVTFANIENDDKGQKTIKKIEKKPPVERQKRRMKARNINRARGKGRFKK